jgi:hypothetical protein
MLFISKNKHNSPKIQWTKIRMQHKAINRHSFASDVSEDIIHHACLSASSGTLAATSSSMKDITWQQLCAIVQEV